MPVSEQFKENIKQLEKLRQESLKEHNAIDMFAGENYVAYISETENGYKAEIWSWGVRRDDMEAGTIEGLKDKVHQTYDLC